MLDLIPTLATLPCFLLAAGTAQLWYAAPLIASISLVYAATRNEEIGPILVHAARFALWIVGFMLAVMVGLQILAWLL